MPSSSITHPEVVGRSGRCQQEATRRWCDPRIVARPGFVADRYGRCECAVRAFWFPTVGRGGAFRKVPLCACRGRFLILSRSGA